jgi:short-subunit dehydrogenase
MTQKVAEVDKQITAAIQPSAEATSTAQATPAPAQTTSGAGWVVIVGASSAIGRALSHQFADGGYDLILAGRDLDDINRSADDVRVRFDQQVGVVSFDALAFDTHANFWSECKRLAGGNVTGMIVLHGQLPVQADGQADVYVARQAIDINFTSIVSILTLAANDLEAKRAGFLCVFSSVAGDRGRQSNYVYGSAKAALSAFLQGLRNRLFKSGVNVLTVKPGFVDTAMTWGLPGMFLVASPQKVAADVYEAVKKGKSEIYTPFFWRYIMLIIKSVPEVVFKRMKM